MKHLPHTPSLANFRRAGKAIHRSRWALKGDLIRAVLSLGEDAPTGDMLKSLRGCGSAFTPPPKDGAAPKVAEVAAKRQAGPDGRDKSGWTEGIIHCNRRLCPVCGLRIAVRRILVLRARAKWVGEHNPMALHTTGALTCRHRDGNEPRQKYDALSLLWDDYKKQDWVSGRKKHGVVVIPRTLLGYFMAAEDTFGVNGHHPHLQFGASLDVPPTLGADGRTAYFEAFRERSQAWFRENAPRFGLTCEWKERWMTMATSPIDAVVRYILKGEKEEAVSDLMGQGLTRKEALTRLWLEKEAAMAAISGEVVGLAREATLGQLKLDRTGASFFDMPIIEQVRLWNGTKGMRWFRVGGIWRDAQTDKSDEELAKENETAGVRIAGIAPSAWTYLACEIWHVLAGLVEDVRFSRGCVANVWEAAQAMAFERMDQRSIRDTLVSMIPASPEQEIPRTPES